MVRRFAVLLGLGLLASVVAVSPVESPLSVASVAAQVPIDVPDIGEEVLPPNDIEEVEPVVGGTLPLPLPGEREVPVAEVEGVQPVDGVVEAVFDKPAPLLPVGVYELGDERVPLEKGHVRLSRGERNEAVPVVLSVLPEEVTARVSGMGLAFELISASGPAGVEAGEVWEIAFGFELFEDSIVELGRIGLIAHLGCDLAGDCETVEVISGQSDVEAGELVFEIPAEVVALILDPVVVGEELPDGGVSAMAPPGSSVYFGASGLAGSSQSDYAASELSSLSSWQVGLQSGSAELSYGVPVPPAVGPAPTVGFQYSSGSVDGMHSSSNNQASKYGIGWNSGTPVITRATRTCAGVAGDEGDYVGNLCLADSSENGFSDYNDRHDGFNLSMNGVGGILIRTTTSLDGLNHPQISGAKYWEYDLQVKNDMRIRRVEQVNPVAGTANGDILTTWWEVTTGDGTLHVFGREFQFKPDAGETGPFTTRDREAHARSLPDAGGNFRPSLMSAKVAPVWMGNFNAQTINGKSMAGACPVSLCDIAVEWHLDQVIDTNGNMATYHYWTESNWYAPKVNGNTIARRQYERSLNPFYVDYGHSYGESAYGETEASSVAFRVRFDYKWRNFTTANPNGDITSGANWQDTPIDLACGPTGACDDYSPAFYTYVAIAKVSVFTSGTAGVEHRLEHAYPIAPGESGLSAALKSNPKLWLSRIQRFAGTDSLPSTKFDANTEHWKANRVNNHLTTSPGNNVPPMQMPRVGFMTTELGGQTKFVYGQSHPPTDTGDCKRLARVDYIRMPCDMYIAWDAHTGSGGAVMWAKWKVVKTEADPKNGGSQVQVVDYLYPTPPKWAYSYQVGRGPNVTSQCKAGHGCGYWNDYRGHDQVITTTLDINGNPNTDQVRHHFGTGMSDDRAGASGTTTLGTSGNVPDVFGTLRSNPLPMAGRSLGTRAANSSNQAYDSERIIPSFSVTQQPGISDRFRETQLLSDMYTFDSPGSWASYQRVRYLTYNDLMGRPQVEYDYGLASTADDDRNIRREYAIGAVGSLPANDEWVVSPVRLEALRAGLTASAHTNGLLALAKNYFDNAAFGTAPTFGHLTKAETQIRLNTNDTPVFTATENVYELAAADSIGQLKSTTVLGDPGTTADDQLTSFSYDSTHGYLTSVNGPLFNDTVTYGRDPQFGHVIEQTIPNPIPANASATLFTEIGYDGFGRIEEVTSPGVTEPTLKIEYSLDHSAANSVYTQSLRHGTDYAKSWTFSDGFGRQIQAQTRLSDTANPVVTSTAFDDQGRVEYQTRPATYTGTTLGSLVNINWTTPNVAHSRTTYPADIGMGCNTGVNTKTEMRRKNKTVWSTSNSQQCGRITNSWDPTGLTKTTTSGARGRVLSTTDAEGTSLEQTTEYEYNGRDQLTVIRDDDLNEIEYEYALMETQATKLTDPDLGIIDYTYDDHQRLKTQIDGRGSDKSQTAINYNLANSPTLATHVVGGSTYDVMEWEYDTAGRLIEDVNYNTWGLTGNPGGTVTTDYVYDTRGLLESQSLTIPGLSGAQEVSYEYQDSGQVFKTTHPGDQKLTHYYDGLDRLAKIVVQSGTQTPQSAMRYVSYDTTGQPRYVFRGNDASPEELRTLTQYSTDTGLMATHLAYVGSPGYRTVQYLTYYHDAASHITRIRESSDAHLTEPSLIQNRCYDYDGMHRVSRGYTTSNACTSVDTSGPDPFDVNIQYDPNGNITNATGPETPGGAYTYPTNGTRPHAVTTAGTDTYSYDDAGNMSARTVDGQSSQYYYGVQNRLQTIAGASTGTFMYDASGNRVKRILSGEPTVYYVGSMEIEQVSGTLTRTLQISGPGGPIGQFSDNKLTTLAGDNQGSVSVTRDTTGTETKQRYLPFGAVRNSGTNVLDSDRTYTDQIDDPGTGLMHYNARQYDPRLGRFVQADALIPNLGLTQDLNRYSYVRNNPLTYNDPTGTETCDVKTGACWDDFEDWVTGSHASQCRCASPIIPTASSGNSSPKWRPRPEAGPWWSNWIDDSAAREAIRETEEFRTVGGSGVDVSTDLLILLYLQEGGYARYGVDGLSNRVGRDSYGPMSLRDKSYFGFSSSEDFVASSRDLGDALILATYLLNDIGPEVNGTGQDRERRLFLAYASGTELIKAGNAADWDVSQIGNDVLVERDRFYRYWKGRLDEFR